MEQKGFLEIAEMDESQAREYLERIRWPDGPVCPHCGNDDNVYKLQGESTRPGLHKCGKCRKQFTVTVGTVMHRSHISIKRWVMAFALMCSSKKGISALELQRKLSLGSYKTAWFMAHRIRAAMQEAPLKGMLQGEVEADETYVGGHRKGGKRGRGSENKTPVMALVEREGKVRSKPVGRVDANSLKGEIREHVDPDATIITDEWKSYRGIGSEYRGGHQIIRHSVGEFSRGTVNTNTVESFFALLKRGYVGTFHYMSRKHLHRYCHEFNFRWNYRKVSDAERAVLAMSQVAGKRLMYKPPVGLV